MTAPSLRIERAILRDLGEGATLAAVDEVGRGALAGPVAVGIVIVDATIGPAPRGVRDSKDCPPAERERLAPLVRSWARSCAVGMASAEEIDRIGIVAALALSAARAMNALGRAPEAILLDGSHDWLSRYCRASHVTTRVSADATCAAVSAASIVAKVARDAVMEQLSALAPEYGWQANRGYAAPEHIAALERHGASRWHRRSWRLPGVNSADQA